MKKKAKFKCVESTECVLYIYFDVDGYPYKEEIPMRFLLNSIGCDSLCEEDVEMFIAQDIEDIEYEYNAHIINKEYMRKAMRKAYSQYHI